MFKTQTVPSRCFSKVSESRTIMRQSVRPAISNTRRSRCARRVKQLSFAEATREASAACVITRASESQQQKSLFSAVRARVLTRFWLFESQSSRVNSHQQLTRSGDCRHSQIRDSRFGFNSIFGTRSLRGRSASFPDLSDQLSFFRRSDSLCGDLRPPQLIIPFSRYNSNFKCVNFRATYKVDGHSAIASVGLPRKKISVVA